MRQINRSSERERGIVRWAGEEIGRETDGQRGVDRQTDRGVDNHRRRIDREMDRWRRTDR